MILLLLFTVVVVANKKYDKWVSENFHHVVENINCFEALRAHNLKYQAEEPNMRVNRMEARERCVAFEECIAIGYRGEKLATLLLSGYNAQKIPYIEEPDPNLEDMDCEVRIFNGRRKA